MNQFVTTYRKDYLWPYVRTFGSKPDQARLYQPGGEPGGDANRELRMCECHQLGVPQRAEQTGVLGPNHLNDESWSRLGPMGPLLDPKLYPARVGASPESQISRFNQPSVFLERLKEKYPFIYECLRTAPPDDLISRINRDRLRTTYQVDYCKMSEYPDAPYDELIRMAGVAGQGPCPEPIKLPGDPFRPNQKSIAYRPTSITGGGKCSSSGGGMSGGDHSIDNKHCIGTCHGPLASTTHGVSEYMDGVSRLGQLIMKENLHQKHRR